MRLLIGCALASALAACSMQADRAATPTLSPSPSTSPSTSPGLGDWDRAACTAADLVGNPEGLSESEQVFAVESLYRLAKARKRVGDWVLRESLKDVARSLDIITSDRRSDDQLLAVLQQDMKEAAPINLALSLRRMNRRCRVIGTATSSVDS